MNFTNFFFYFSFKKRKIKVEHPNLLPANLFFDTTYHVVIRKNLKEIEDLILARTEQIDIVKMFFKDSSELIFLIFFFFFFFC
jgi:hypothetical protein